MERDRERLTEKVERGKPSKGRLNNGPITKGVNVVWIFVWTT